MPGRAEERGLPIPLARAHLKWPDNYPGVRQAVLIKSDGMEIHLNAENIDPVYDRVVQEPDCISIPSMGIEIAKIIGFRHLGRPPHNPRDHPPEGIDVQLKLQDGWGPMAYCESSDNLNSIIKLNNCNPSNMMENNQGGGKRLKRKAKHSSKTRAKRRKSRRVSRRA